VGVPGSTVLSRDRRAAVVWARARVCRRLRGQGFTLSGIGAVLGFDHTTVLHAVRRALPEVPPRLKERAIIPAPAQKSFAVPPVPPKGAPLKSPRGWTGSGFIASPEKSRLMSARA
jgi:hypothetical protein